MNRLRNLFYFLLIAGAVALVWLVLSAPPGGGEVYVRGKSYPRNRHDAAHPRNVPEEKFNPRLLVLRAVDRARIPFVDRFDSPLGSANGAFSYDAQPFGEQNDKRGGKHSGQDLNGIGGENTDEGDPVYASARGLVIYAGNPSPYWGNVIILAHKLPDGRIVQTLYGHLKKINFGVRRIVGRGEKIGEVGSADGLYWAHLHYESLFSTFNESNSPGYFQNRTNRFDPEELNQLIGDKMAPPDSDDIFSYLDYLELERRKLNS